MAQVRLEGVGKRFEDVVAVDDFNLTIADQEFIVLVGPSGCGKTTTLRMIAGLESISLGGIFVNDRLINNLPAKDRNIAMVFQNYALYPHMTVFDNMAFSLEMRKRPAGEIKARVMEAAEILGIQELLHRKPKQLSGGQRQRVAVGRAIVRKPEVFLFDEPLSNLDAKLRVQMRVELKKLHERLATTAVYVTHDQVEAMTLGDRIVVMKDGLIQQAGTPLALYNSPANMFVAGFLGSPAMNFIEAGLAEEGDALFLKTSAFSLVLPDKWRGALAALDGDRVVLGLRPEDFHLTDEDLPGRTIPAVVEVVEPIGSETYVAVRSGDISFVAGVGRKTVVSPHQNILLAPLMDHLQLFDVQTHKAIPAPSGS